MKTYIYLAATLGGLALLGGAFAYGYSKGSAAELSKIAKKTAETQQELFDLADTVREQTDELRRLQQEKMELINGLEQEAVSAVGANAPGVSSTGGLQRLERRWGPSPRSTD